MECFDPRVSTIQYKILLRPTSLLFEPIKQLWDTKILVIPCLTKIDQTAGTSMNIGFRPLYDSKKSIQNKQISKNIIIKNLFLLQQ